MDEGVGLADGFLFLASSHAAEPTIALIVKKKRQSQKEWYTYLVVLAQGAAQGKSFAGEGGTLARRS